VTFQLGDETTPHNALATGTNTFFLTSGVADMIKLLAHNKDELFEMGMIVRRTPPYYPTRSLLVWRPT
jgi:hypothetical protein